MVFYWQLEHQTGGALYWKDLISFDTKAGGLGAQLVAPT